MSKILVVINGKEQEISKDSTIQNILDSLLIKSSMHVVEKNLHIITKEQYDEIIQDGDKLEIVGFFSGG